MWTKKEREDTIMLTKRKLISALLQHPAGMDAPIFFHDGNKIDFITDISPDSTVMDERGILLMNEAGHRWVTRTDPHYGE